MSYRSDAVRAAIKEWREHPEGRTGLYYQETGGTPGTDWCGMFVLRNLHKAGLALGVKWIQGRGFIDPLKLPQVKTPLPGDVAYVPQPFQHQAMVVEFDPVTGMVTTIDGNQPGIEPRVRFTKNGNIEFYSIQPLVDAAEAAAYPWGYLVAGAAIAGLGAWIWINGVPRPVSRALTRVGL